MNILNEAIPKYFHKYLGKPDPRVKDWFLLNSPIYMIIILTCYFKMLYFGQRFMKNRIGFQLRTLLITYNCFQVILSTYIFKEVLVSAYLSKYQFKCSEIDKNNKDLAIRMAKAFWYFYVTKILDLCDTVFFVLRKKRNQITFLHVYHHSTMIFNWYLGILYLPGGQTFFSVLLNSLVHVIMYLYYMLAAFGPHMQKYLQWKKYLTQLQLTQFALCIVHLLTGYYNECKAPTWLMLFTITYLCTMLILFVNYYRKAYLQKKRQQRDLAEGDKLD